MRSLVPVILATFLIATPAGAQDTPLGEAELDFTRIEAFIASQTALVEELQAQAALDLQNSQEAELVFDRMIQSYQELIDAAGSDSPTVVTLEAFIADREALAASFIGSANPSVRALAPEAQAQAEMAKQLQATAIQEAARAIRQIAELEEARELAVAQFQLRQGERVLAAVRRQIEALKQSNDEVQKVIDTARGANLPIAEGPAIQQ